ncbi:hypothetical protein HKBW3S06_01305, partial [Candidatus Hakubella thermalkaliphila]
MYVKTKYLPVLVLQTSRGIKMLIGCLLPCLDTECSEIVS